MIYELIQWAACVHNPLPFPRVCYADSFFARDYCGVGVFAFPILQNEFVWPGNAVITRKAYDKGGPFAPSFPFLLYGIIGQRYRVIHFDGVYTAVVVWKRRHVYFAPGIPSIRRIAPAYPAARASEQHMHMSRLGFPERGLYNAFSRKTPMIYRNFFACFPSISLIF